MVHWCHTPRRIHAAVQPSCRVDSSVRRGRCPAMSELQLRELIKNNQKEEVYNSVTLNLIIYLNYIFLNIYFNYTN